MAPGVFGIGRAFDGRGRHTLTRRREPRRINDVYFMADTPEQVLDIRLLAFSKSGLRLRGHTNYAAIEDKDEFRERAYAYDDKVTYYPRKVTDVPQRLRDTWQGEPIPGQLEGPGDKRIAQFDIRLMCSLTTAVCTPGISAAVSSHAHRSPVTRTTGTP